MMAAMSMVCGSLGIGDAKMLIYCRRKKKGLSRRGHGSSP